MDFSFDSLLRGFFAEPFFLGDEYIVYYIQGLTSPTTAAREGTIVYLRVIIIWEFLQMLSLQYVKLCKIHFWFDFLLYICSMNI